MKYLALALAGLLVTSTAASASQVKSVRVIDGDTMWLNNTHKIRLVGIDAPEIETRLLNKSTCPVEEKALGLKAKARAVDLLDMSKHRVTVKYAKGKDVWKRNLGTVYSDGKSVAKILVAEGLALPWPDMRHPRPVFCLPAQMRRMHHHR
jgi:endonuclease YncB( thermonuclease family)